jgi:hypothetical protein
MFMKLLCVLWIAFKLTALTKYSIIKLVIWCQLIQKDLTQLFQ